MIQIINQIIKCWAVEMTITKTIELLKVDDIDTQREFVGRVFSKLRHVAIHNFESSKIKLGQKYVLIIN